MTLRALALAVCLLAPGAGGQVVEIPEIPLRFRVVLAPSADSARVDSTLSAWKLRHRPSYGSEWVVWIPAIAPVDWRDSLLLAPWTAVVVADELEVLADPLPADSAPPDAALSADEPTAISWNVDFVRAPELWAEGIDGSDRVVMIIDTGIDCDHPLLFGRIRGGYGFSRVDSATGRRDTCGAWDDTVPGCNGHGTHVAGTVAGSGGIGVAPGAEVFAAQVYEVISGKCANWSSNRIAAIRMAEDSGWTMNVSTGGPGGSASESIATSNAALAGAFLAGAAGNAGTLGVYRPGGYSYALAVGGVSSSGARASWSSYGPELDVMAPGAGIVSALPGGGTGSKSGTSMATPHGAGCVALLLQARPDLTVSELLWAIAETAVDRGAPGRDPYYGNGLLDCYAAVHYVQETPEIRPTLTIADSLRFSLAAGTGVRDTIAVATKVDTWQIEKSELPPGLVFYAVGVVAWGYLTGSPPVGAYSFPVTWP